MLRFVLQATLLATFATADSRLPPLRQTKRDACSELELVIARGTTEPLLPTYGAIVGDPLYAATKLLIPGMTAHAVDVSWNICVRKNQKSEM
jgi:hypothetical protein